MAALCRSFVLVGESGQRIRLSLRVCHLVRTGAGRRRLGPRRAIPPDHTTRFLRQCESEMGEPTSEGSSSIARDAAAGAESSIALSTPVRNLVNVPSCLQDPTRGEGPRVAREIHCTCWRDPRMIENH